MNDRLKGSKHQWMPESQLAKEALKYKPKGHKSVGRPRIFEYGTGNFHEIKMTIIMKFSLKIGSQFLIIKSRFGEVQACKLRCVIY